MHAHTYVTHLKHECLLATGISTQARTSLPLLNLVHRSEVTHVIGGSQFDGP